MLVIAAPGQGAQTPGFLAPWLELPGIAGQIGQWSDLAGQDLVRLGRTGTAEEIRNTAVAQPLLVASALAAAGALGLTGPQAPVHGCAVAGHSVGELAAGTIAKVIDPSDAMRLVGVRGRAMADAAEVQPTSMMAVLGGDEQDVLESIEAHGLSPANINCAGQIVAAGTVEELAAFAADPPVGARLRPLRVAGAFHTRHMEPAVSVLREAAAPIQVSDPCLPLLSNRDGAVVQTGRDWIERIITQISAPVRWDACMRAMTRLRTAVFIELPPAGTLVGLARRGLPGVTCLAVKTPDDLPGAAKLLAEQTGDQSAGQIGELAPASPDDPISSREPEERRRQHADASGIRRSQSPGIRRLPAGQGRDQR